MPTGPRQHLIFDADDTLWENNVVFEGVIADFIAWLDHPGLTAAEVRAVMDGIEREHAAEYGYGTKVFELTLEATVRRLHDGRLTRADEEQIATLMARLRWDRLDIIDGVPETLAELRRRHDLLLLTKGDQEEQVRKIERSGLAELFRRTLVTPEKTEATYRGVVAGERLDPRPHLDDRELAEVGHPAGGRRRPAGRLHRPPAHVAPGGRRPAGRRPHPARGHVPRPARAVLSPQEAGTVPTGTVPGLTGVRPRTSAVGLPLRFRSGSDPGSQG